MNWLGTWPTNDGDHEIRFDGKNFYVFEVNAPALNEEDAFFSSPSFEECIEAIAEVVADDGFEGTIEVVNAAPAVRPLRNADEYVAARKQRDELDRLVREYEDADPNQIVADSILRSIRK